MNSILFLTLLCLAGLLFGSVHCKEFKVASIFSPPFVMMKRDANQTVTYSGFVPDFLASFKDESCQFSFMDMKSSMIGENDWKTVVKALNDEQADIAGGPIAKGPKTDRRVRFTGKFAEHEGWTALVRRPVSMPRDVISESLTLFRPFKVEVWLAIVVAFAVVTVLMALVNLVNPYEWRNLYKRDKIPKTDASQLSPMGSILIVFTTLTWQGYEKTPRSVGGRVLLLFWVAFVAVTLIAYIGNMANLLNYEAHERSRGPQPKISHPFGLMDKASKGMKFGTVNSWPLLEHLKTHPDMTVRKLGNHLTENGERVASIEEGIKRVLQKDQDYALVVDTVVAKYITGHLECGLMMLDVVEPGDMRGYTFATYPHPAGGRNDNNDDRMCLKDYLQQLSRNEDTKAIWKMWNDKDKYGRCKGTHEPDKKVPSTPVFVPVNVYQFCGPLALVGLGLILCILVTVAEVTVHYVSNKLQKVNILGASSPIEEERRLHDDLDDDLKA